MEKAQQLITDNPVVVFSKTWCSYSRRAKTVLGSLGANVKVYELDKQADGDDIQDALADLTGQTTVPNIFIGKQHIGGCDDLMYLAVRNRDSLVSKLREAGALPEPKKQEQPATPKVPQEDSDL
jgi:glutaredoxin 3